MAAAGSPCIPSANCLVYLAAALPFALPFAPSVAGEALFSAFGVFDGHGGRQVATFASNNLLKAVMAEVDASPIPLQVCSTICLVLGMSVWFSLSIAGRRVLLACLSHPLAASAQKPHPIPPALPLAAGGARG